jgi:D-alanyl-D-alanine dipeptidase
MELAETATSVQCFTEVKSRSQGMADMRFALMVVAAIAVGLPRSAFPNPHVRGSQPELQLLTNATQLVVVTTPEWDSTAGELQRFSRANTHASWRAVDVAYPIVVGRTGLAWGVGLNGAGPHKHEGDGKSPAGVFPVGTVFGYAPADSVRWLHMPYLQLTSGTDCVDDTASVQYNKVVDRGAVPKMDWNSSEHMRSVKEYEMGAVIEYNAAPPVKGRGSCIFFHIWNGPRSSTAGCTAMERANLTRLLAWLDPKRNPVVVQLPSAVYAQQRRMWKLPLLAQR